MTLSVETLAEAMQNAVIRDDEGEFPRLLDLLGFSGENKARTVTRGLATAAFTAIEQAGYVVVPREASDEMIQNAWQQIDWILGPDPRPEGCTSTFDDVRDAYDAALSAAPKIQHSEGE